MCLILFDSELTERSERPTPATGAIKATITNRELSILQKNVYRIIIIQSQLRFNIMVLHGEKFRPFTKDEQYKCDDSKSKEECSNYQHKKHYPVPTCKVHVHVALTTQI